MESDGSGDSGGAAELAWEGTGACRAAAALAAVLAPRALGAAATAEMTAAMRSAPALRAHAWRACVGKGGGSDGRIGTGLDDG